MRPRSRRSPAANERGFAMVFVLLSIVFLLVLGGLAVDFAYLFVVDDELEKSMDAASLAAAGKLGFDDTVFPTVYAFGQAFANNNNFRVGTVSLTPNPIANPADYLPLSDSSYPDTYGDIILGIWDPSKADGVGLNMRFEPSTDGTRVNAVMCRYKTTINTGLFRLWGLNTMPVSATAIAVANPPRTPPTDACLFPIGLGDCPFEGQTTLGCGAPITFITSSGQTGEGCLAPPCSNTAGWVNLEGGEANAEYLKGAIAAAASGECASSPLETGDTIEANNGMIQSVFNDLEPVFEAKYGAIGDNGEPIQHVVEDSEGRVVYRGQGWKVYIPVIETGGCPPQAVNGSREIRGWTEFVITQVINHGNCAVANHNPVYPDNPELTRQNAWDPLCPAPNGTGENVPQNSGAFRGIFGYYKCGIIEANPNPTPTPRSALATKLRLVK